jgi:hypothetical protein
MGEPVMLAQLSVDVSSLLPGWLTLTLAGALLAATVYGLVTMLRKKVRPRWVAVLAGLRLAILGTVLLILLQPVVSYTQTAVPLPEVLVMVDTSQSMSQPGGTGGTRLAEVLAALDQGDFSAALRSRFRPRWFRFDATATPLAAGDLAGLKADGETTQFAESLLGADNLLRAEGHSPRRVLLVSDGNDRGIADPLEAARRLGIIVDVLAPSARESAVASAVELANVQGARRVLLGSETHFRLALCSRRRAGQDRKLSLEILEDGKKIQEHPLILKAGRTEQAFILAHRPASTGLKRYDFQLHAAGGQPASPRKALHVQVVDGKYEILILEDIWRWEYKFLHRLLEDDPGFRFTALLSRGSGSFVQFGSPDRRVNLVDFPQGRAELEGFDIFFLGDVSPSRWAPGLPAALAQLVAEEGKSLVVIAGPGLARLADVPELHALLPVDLTSESGQPVGGPVEVRLRADAGPSPFFFQLRSQEAARLPSLDQIYPVLRKRPAATVLVEAAKHRNAYGNLIILAEHTVGRGRVLFVATDTLWKWHTLAVRDGPSPYSIFWQQAFRALTPGRTRQGSANLWLTASRSQGEVGRPLDLEAEVQADRPLPQARLQAIAELPVGRRLPLDFAPDPANPRRFRAEMAPGVPGLHKITASLVAEGRTVAEGATAFQVESPRGEQSDDGVDHITLDRIAAATGGRVIDPARPETWPAADGQPEAAVPQSRTLDLWGSFTLLLVLCALLGTDWLVRLFKGLV